MNLIWHIIKKDLRRMMWILLTWAASGAYLIFYKNSQIQDLSLGDNLGIVALMTHAALNFALIAAIVQEDGLTQDNEFWRTRPISPGRLLMAKLGLILPTFVGLLGLVILVQTWLFLSRFDHSDLFYIVPALTVVVLCCTAMASCTRNLGAFILGGVLCVMGVTMIGPWLVNMLHIAPLPVEEMIRVTMSKISVTFGLSGAAAIALLLNQYITRRTTVSYGIVIATVTSIPLIEFFWSWAFI